MNSVAINSRLRFWKKIIQGESQMDNFNSGFQQNPDNLVQNWQPVQHSQPTSCHGLSVVCGVHDVDLNLVFFSNTYIQFDFKHAQNLWWGKLGRRGTICWLKKELFMVHLIDFFRNKTFLFVKTEIWNFQHLLDLWFRET